VTGFYYLRPYDNERYKPLLAVVNRLGTVQFFTAHGHQYGSNRHAWIAIPLAVVRQFGRLVRMVPYDTLRVNASSTNQPR
jgi:hypothetical protein